MTTAKVPSFREEKVPLRSQHTPLRAPLMRLPSLPTTSTTPPFSLRSHLQAEVNRPRAPTKPKKASSAETSPRKQVVKDVAAISAQLVRKRSASVDESNIVVSMRNRGIVVSSAGVHNIAEEAARKLNDSDTLLTQGITKLIRSWLDDAPQDGTELIIAPTIFSGEPTCSLEKFVEALVQTLHMFGLTHTWALLMIVYIRRLVLRDTIVVSWENIYRLMLAATLTAIKFHTDEVITNKDFALAIGMPTIDLNRMEIEYLTVMRFDLMTSEAEYHRMCIDVCATASEPS